MFCVKVAFKAKCFPFYETDCLNDTTNLFHSSNMLQETSLWKLKPKQFVSMIQPIFSIQVICCKKQVYESWSQSNLFLSAKSLDFRKLITDQKFYHKKLSFFPNKIYKILTNTFCKSNIENMVRCCRNLHNL